MNWLNAALSPELVRALGWTLVHSLWQGAVVGLALVGLLLVLRRHSAQVRYNVACVALATMLGLALVTFGRHYSVALTEKTTSGAQAGTGSTSSLTVSDPAQWQHSSAATEAVAPGGLQPWLHYFDHNLPLIVSGWLLGLLAMTLRMLGGLAYVQRLKHYRVQALPEVWNERLAALAARAGLQRSITLLESALVKAPLVAGHLKPIILLPLGTVLGLTQLQLEAILAHELAHIARRDYLMNLLQSIAEILFFYHPAAWFITACLRTERENCCDDEATAICGDPLTLARALAALAEMGQAVGPVPQLALSAVGPDGSLLGRIRRLVQRRAAPTFSEGVMAALVVMGGLVLLGLTAAVSMASPRPWTAQAHALTGLVFGRPDTLWNHSLATMPGDTSKPVPQLREKHEMVFQEPGDDDDDKDKKKAKHRAKGKEVGQRVVIVRNEDLEGPGRRGRNGSDGTVIVKRDKKGRATEIIVDGRRIDLEQANKKAKGGSTEIIQLNRNESRGRGRNEDFAFNFNDNDQRPGLSGKERAELQRSLQRMRLDLNLDEIRNSARRGVAKTYVYRNGNEIEIHDGRTGETGNEGPLRENALREAERAIRESIRTEKNDDVREKLQQQAERLQEQREQLHDEQLEREDARRQRDEERRSRDEERRALEEERRALEEERRGREEERRGRDEERRGRDEEQREGAVSRALRADGLITDPENYRMSLNAREMTVNGKKQSATLRDKYLRLLQIQGHKLTTGTYAITRNSSSSTSVAPLPPLPRVPRTPRAPQPPDGARFLPAPPKPPMPPKAPRAPRQAEINSENIGEQLRKDGLIAPGAKSYQLQLDSSGMSVNGQRQSEETAQRYRDLLDHGRGGKFNINISVSE